MTTANVTRLKRKAADLEQKKQLDKALALYIQLVDEAGRDLDDADLQIYNRVGDLLMRQSNVSEALAYYEKAVDMYAERGFLNNAIALCNKILRQSPARTAVYYKLGKIAASKGFRSDARKNFLEYADRMQKAGNLDEAFRSLKEFADLCPDQDDIRLLLADLLTKEDRKGEAVEQLEQLYSKLEAEGRSAEARATMDRIKAIDPEITPRASGAFIAQKTNDLVFLDLNEPVEPVAHVSPVTVTPVADPLPIVETPGVGALEGLAVTFFPEQDAPGEPAVAAPLDGIEIAEPVIDDGADIPHLELVGTEHPTPADPVAGIEFETPVAGSDALDDVVTPVDGLAPITATITDTHPSLAPLLNEPVLTEAEFSDLALTSATPAEAPRAHDLALPSSLPQLGPVPLDGDLSDESHDVGAGAVDDTHADQVAEASDDATMVESSAPDAGPPTISEDELAAVQFAHSTDDYRNESDPAADHAVDSDRGIPTPAATATEPPVPIPALDTSTLIDHRRAASGPERTSGGRSAFEEDRVELPLIDLEAQAHAASSDAAFDAAADQDASLDDLLAAPPSFGDAEDGNEFEPPPLDLANEPAPEWDDSESPEVLIDGEWHDEHMGDLVSGEVFVVKRRDATRGPNDGGGFDDLAAAMMYDGGKDGTPPDEGDRPRGPTVSFGGIEVQLRRRLEGDPDNPALHRQLGEALLDDGRRDEGLESLDHAVVLYEERHAVASAREVVDVILRVSPLSVHHHQKRVEYAVRANDRAQLIHAYTELADALFRCGEPEKSRVVYQRVLDLDPENDRAQFALGMLSDEEGPARRSDEIPTIDTGLLSTLHADAAEAPATPPIPADAAPPVPDESRDEVAPDPARLAGHIDAEIDAAFGEVQDVEVPGPVVEAPARSTQLSTARPAWAAEDLVAAPAATPEPAGQNGDDGFVDLGEWLRASEPVRSTRMVSNDVAPSGDEHADFAEMLRRFKEGVSANVDDEDYASHYDLGVAYKEMGLTEEAIAEFQKALRGEDHRVRAYEALGQCFVEQGQHQVATTLLRRALESTRADDQQLVGVLYLLGYSSEAMGRHGDAVGYYQRVFSVDIEFRDVASRLAALDRMPK